MTCRTTGASGTVQSQGLLILNMDGQSAEFWDLENTGTATIDTTSSQAIDATWQWGTADAGNTITLTNLTIEVLN